MSISLGRYLFRRIHEVGVRSVMGLPGDFQLKLLDKIYEVDGLAWIGNSNELNAAYAADGYARASGGAACLVTTHGVGELSAINGVAGSMSEHIKVIHIVGQTPRQLQSNNVMIHHSIGQKPDHTIYSAAVKDFCADATVLSDIESAPAQIDRVIQTCFTSSKPVYIHIPIDMVDEQVPEQTLQPRIDLSPSATSEPPSDDILSLLYSAISPALYVDVLSYRHGVAEHVTELVDKLNIPTYTSNMGKAVVDENHRNFVGVYSGIVSSPGVAAAFEKSDLVIAIGRLPANTNTGGFTQKFPAADRLVELAHDGVVLNGKKVFNGRLYQILPHLLQHLDATRLPQITKPQLPQCPPQPYDQNSTNIVHAWLWPVIAKFLQPNDTILADTGTAPYGIQDISFPPSTNWQVQSFWGSIGWATPAAFGADLALRDRARVANKPRGRTLLFTGDGSFQLTMQEVGTMIMKGVKPILFIINNNGYTIERVIHGAKQSYNDIFPCDYSLLLQFYGMPEHEAKESFHRCSTREELTKVLALDSVKDPRRTTVVEITMDAFDAPWRLTTILGHGNESQVTKMREGGFQVNGV